ncbi:MAG: hypothetical protein OET46_06735 [Xanthomonadales bacterium]|nr:hypothetical protein [Xanthomonadales bacterium]
MSNSLNSNVEELIFILGTRRSGASRLAQNVAELGYDFPDDPFSLHSIASIHQRFLIDVGSHWKDPCPLPQGIFEGEQATAAKRSIRQFLQRETSSAIIINDPCLCRLFPLWTETLKAFDCKIRALEIIRDPKQLFDSLRRKFETDEKFNSEISSRNHSNMLWWRYVSEARHHIQGWEFLTIPFENMKYDPQHQLELIYTFLEKAGPDPSNVIAKEHHNSGTSIQGEAASTDSERFLFSAHFHLLRSKTPLPSPAIDISPPPGAPAHPWPESTYEAVSAAMLKHFSGTVAHSTQDFSIHKRAQSSQNKRPIDVLFVSDKPTWPSHIYRVKNPVDALNRHGLNAVWVDQQYIIREPKILDRALRVIIHRMDWGPEFKNIVQECRKKRIPVGYDLDDLLFIPELIASGARDAVSRLGPHEIQRWIQRSEDYQRCVREVDYFIGATQLLTTAAMPINQDCRYIFNGFSPENLLMADLAHSRLNSNGKETVTIGYASGTATHRADFDVVAETLWQLMSEDPRLLLTIVGTLDWETKPPAEVEKRISTRPLVPHVSLPFELARFDINIIPLERNAFCDAKSPLKFFEAGLVNVPTIATRNPTYETLGEISQGCLLADDQASWHEHLRQSSTETALRKQLGTLARQAAIENFHCDLTVDMYAGLPNKNES